MIKAILFDFGGVIYEHPKEVIPVVLSKVYDKPLELCIKEYAKYKGNYFKGQLETEDLITSLSSTFNSNLTTKKARDLWLKYYPELAKPNKEVLNIIKDLRKNYKVYLFSNTTEVTNEYNSKTGIYDLFDGLFLSFKMGMEKPDKEIYEKVISSIGFKPNECVFIDDGVNNIESARQLGIKTVLFNILKDPPSRLKEELRKLDISI